MITTLYWLPTVAVAGVGLILFLAALCRRFHQSVFFLLALATAVAAGIVTELGCIQFDLVDPVTGLANMIFWLLALAFVLLISWLRALYR
jgi:hypothetical protein